MPRSPRIAPASMIFHSSPTTMGAIMLGMKSSGSHTLRIQTRDSFGNSLEDCFRPVLQRAERSVDEWTTVEQVPGKINQWAQTAVDEGRLR